MPSTQETIWKDRQSAFWHTGVAELVEGANKSVIGGRLNLSGARWSEAGARGMVFVRVEYHSHRVLTDFHQVRHQALPRLALSVVEGAA